MKPDVSRPESLGSARNLAASGKPSEELQSLEEDLREAREYAEAIVEAAPPLLVLDADLRVKSANESFYRLFAVSRLPTQSCLVYEGGSACCNFPALRTFVEEVLPLPLSFDAFEMPQGFKTIGRRTVLL